MPTLQPLRLPHPTHEAELLLGTCDDNMTTARGEARYNYIHAASDSEAAFWFAVIQALRGQQA
jgi:hypothetical protein